MRLNVILDDAVLQKLDAWCCQRGLSRSAALRLILNQFFADGKEIKL